MANWCTEEGSKRLWELYLMPVARLLFEDQMRRRLP